MFKQLVTAALMITGMGAVAHAQDKVSDLEKRVSELEASSSVNIFKFSGYLESRYDNLNTSQTTPATTALNGKTNYSRMTLGLNADADVSKYIKFYSRLGASKFLNKLAGGVPDTTADLDASRAENGSQVYIEKAYVDISILDTGLTFSMGRLPTIDGPPVHLIKGEARMGTYPAMAYNSILDGYALSYNKALTDADTMALRAIYTPFTYSSSTNYATPYTSGGNKANNTVDLVAWMAEYSHSGGFAKTINVIYQGYQTGYLNFDTNTIAASAPIAVTGTGNFGTKISAHTLYAELNEIGNTGLDFAASYIMTSLQSTGTATTNIGNFYGLGAASDGDKLNGSASYANLRYHVIRPLYIGADYLWGADNVYISGAAADDLTNFLGTTGNAWRAYAIYKFTNELTGTLGYSEQNYKKTAASFGSPADSDLKIKTTYATLRADF